MTVSISNTFSGQAGNRNTSGIAADKADTPFKRILGDDATSRGAKHSTPHSHRSRTDTNSLLLSDAGDSPADAGNEATTEAADNHKVSHLPFVSGKAVHLDDDGTGQIIEKSNETTPDIVPERLPVIISLLEISRASTPGNTQDNFNKTESEDRGVGGSRTPAPTISEPELTDNKAARTDISRNIEAQTAAHKTALAPTVAMEKGAEAEATANINTARQNTFTGQEEEARSSQAATPESGSRIPVQERISVVSVQSVPAPALPGLDLTTARLVTAIASDITPQNAPPSANLVPVIPHQSPLTAQILKIELHPAELGMVNAQLRLIGEQLSIELTPGTHEAFRRLSSDGDTIARALRDLGFDVGKITILQPSVAISPAPRTDLANSTTAMPNRESPSFQSGQSGGNGTTFGGQQSGRGRDDEARNSGHAPSISRTHSSSGLFI